MVMPRKDAEFSHLRGEFQQKHDGSFAWESMVSAYLALPALRGFWPMSASDESGNIRDFGEVGGGLHLTNRNTVLHLATPMPVMDFTSGNSEVLYRADAAAFDIQGNEAFVHSDYRGLTMGAWVQFDAVDQNSTLMGKWDTAANQRSYIIYLNGSTSKISFYWSTNGTLQPNVEYDTALVAGRWYFVCGRFDPSTEAKIWVNDNFNVDTTSIPATLFNGTASFAIGAYGTQPATWLDYMDGRVSMAFLCAAYLPDHTVRRLYYRTRALFQTRETW